LKIERHPLSKNKKKGGNIPIKEKKKKELKKLRIERHDPVHGYYV
jgi:hypothetical protein